MTATPTRTAMAMPGLRHPQLAPLALVAPLVGLQIAYPLAHGAARTHLAVLIVAAFGLVCVTHLALTRGYRTVCGVLAATAGVGLVIEVVGVHTGVPFGDYRYSAALGPQIFGVPWLIGLAWTMVAWPAAAAARRLVRNPLARVLVGAWATAAADLFLDPQLVALGAWHWTYATPHLPGVGTVPLTNYIGWLVAALLVSALVQRVVGDGPDAVPIGLYLWMWAGWAVAHACFLDMPASAAWGTVGMGLVAVPLAARLLR